MTRRLAYVLALLLVAACSTTAPPPSNLPSATEAPHCGPPPYWSYEHQSDWGTHWPVCGAGERQSPIDVVPNRTAALPPLGIDWTAMPLIVTNNGHTIQVQGNGSQLTVDGETYKLVQWHSHTPSEHTIRGTRYPLEIHFVHENEKKQVAVIGVVFDRGVANGALDELTSRLPVAACTTKDFGTKIDARGLLPQSLGYDTYPGSLTTPDCAEGVRWFVLTTPSFASDDQIAALRAPFPGGNARNLQPVNGREIVQPPTP